MILYAPALLLLLLFAIGVRRDRRRFRNAVYLGLGITFLAFALLVTLGQADSVLAETVLIAIVLVPAVGTLVLAGLLIANGFKMLRKEGRRLGNLLSLLCGVGILVVVALLVAAVQVQSPVLAVIARTTFLLSFYLSFLFVCFVGYAYLYGRLTPRQDVDYVVVLGSGLLGGTRVPPLLASRLERGRALYERQAAQGRPPLLITSGGQGPDEQLPESHAMADWLTERGFPADRIVLEDRSRTTEENLRFSRELMIGADPDYRCVVVTNNFHAFRAAILARREGVNGQVAGSPTAAYFWPSATIREFVAVLVGYKWINLGVCAFITLLSVTG
ncbi:YdcF family protein [Kitasatospora sp. NPDC092948]|uniref:YdcF family protein n=1 Tax=Kitasatospora sp. NPDC092948 TaxID=3364088 RepID=UPI0038204CE1